VNSDGSTGGSRGRFITLEGGEGAGKSTQVARLAAALRGDGRQVVTTREPGGEPGAEAIRELLLARRDDPWDPMTEALLHFAARREHLIRVILPAIENGDWVISDRFADSTMAYQSHGLGVAQSTIDALYRETLGEFRPDLTFILDLPVEQGLARAAGRGQAADRYESMGLDFHRRLRDGFLEIARNDPDRCVVLDASRPVDEISEQLTATVRDRLDT
jgi:dTMP kinase